MIKKTLGGDRLGSGNRMKAELHNYQRSTHDLGNVWRSSMAPGVLVPFYKKVALNGDTWSINLRELVRTMPATGPLFGSYKLQMDIFEVPMRLYNGILHNNMTKIGMEMQKVKLPKVELYHNYYNRLIYDDMPEKEKQQVSSSSLMAYLGVRGLGNCTPTEDSITNISRKFNAIPMLAYYDIFKNYYANKQEEKAYVIDSDIAVETSDITRFTMSTDEHRETEMTDNMTKEQYLYDNMLYEGYTTPLSAELWTTLTTYFKSSLEPQINIVTKGKITNNVILYVADVDSEYPALSTGYVDRHWFKTKIEEDGTTTIYDIDWDNWRTEAQMAGTKFVILGIGYIPYKETTEKINLKAFKLENIDKMRIDILKETNLGDEFLLNEHDYLPYSANWKKKDDNNSGCRNIMTGLVVKTYQSDIFNAWLSAEWIDSIKGINEISAVAIEEGKFTIDALNLAHKVYNMLNRIAVSGGTYEDWQEAVYGEDALRRAESPIYCGGASATITFEEVVSTADTETSAAGDQPLGSLAGKGIIVNERGGNIEIHIKEPSYIMGIVSITPLIDYSQGNDFDMTELDSINDLHKPELDQIGFQDLLLERACWKGTYYDASEEKWVQQAGGKLPAWMDYMTSVNQVYGDFTETGDLGFMVLTRRYEEGAGYDNGALPGYESTGVLQKSIGIKDWTTYINPTKYNYQFANTRLDAQNFWVQIGINATARRKMSAKLIPNL